MYVSDVTSSSAQVLHVVDEVRQLLEWKILDVDAVSDEELSTALHELWMTVLAHASLVSDLVDRVEDVLGADETGLAAALRLALDSLERMRTCFDGLHRHRDVEPAVLAFGRLERALEHLFACEHEVLRTNGTVLFPSQMS